MAKNENEVSEQDRLWLDRHVIDYSDDYRFVGYQSNPEDLLERTLKAAKASRGRALTDVRMDTHLQYDIIEAKKDALVNLLNANDDKANHIDNHVVSSYISKMVDDYAVADEIEDSAGYMEYLHHGRYYEPGDPKLMYTTHTFEGDDSRYPATYDADDLDDIKMYHDMFYPDIIDMEIVGSDKFAYTKGSEESNAVVTHVWFRGERMGDLWGYMEEDSEGNIHIDPDKDVYDSTSFSMYNRADESTRGIYEIEDGDVYRYNESKTAVQKITGKDSVREAEKLTQRSRFLNGYRMRRFNELTEEIEKETGRLSEFDLSAIKPKESDRVIIDPPKMKAIEQQLKYEDELEY